MHTGCYDKSLNKLDYFGTERVADSFRCKMAGILDGLKDENKMAAYQSSCCS